MAKNANEIQGLDASKLLGDSTPRLPKEWYGKKNVSFLPTYSTDGGLEETLITVNDGKLQILLVAGVAVDADGEKVETSLKINKPDHFNELAKRCAENPNVKVMAKVKTWPQKDKETGQPTGEKAGGLSYVHLAKAKKLSMANTEAVQTSEQKPVEA